MKKFVLLGLITAALIFGGVLLAEVFLVPGQLCKWSPVTTHVDGTPCVIGAYELAISPAGQDLNVAPGAKIKSIVYPGDNAWTGLNIDTLISTLPGGKYQLQARARNGGTVWGTWSTPLLGTVDLVPPTAPDGATMRVFIPN